MKTVITSNLPKVWASMPGMKGLICEGDVGILSSRLKAKVLIFDSKKNLQHFHNKVINLGKLGKKILGFCNSMRYEYVDLQTCKIGGVEADKKYFCLICLVKSYLTVNIISHEAVHAGFCYRLRVGNRYRKWHNIKPEDDSENMGLQEEVAYPTGFIVEGIIKLMDKHKLNLLV